MLCSHFARPISLKLLRVQHYTHNDTAKEIFQQHATLGCTDWTAAPKAPNSWVWTQEVENYFFSTPTVLRFKDLLPSYLVITKSTPMSLSSADLLLLANPHSGFKLRFDHVSVVHAPKTVASIALVGESTTLTPEGQGDMLAVHGFSTVVVPFL